MKIIAVGMNYAEHNKELDGALYKPEAPVIFMKADSSLVLNGKPFFLPDDMGRIDYEAEMVVRISRLGKSIPQRFAHRYYDAVTVGIDFTARDMQRMCRDKGLPWDICKGFDGAAVIGQWVELGADNFASSSASKNEAENEGVKKNTKTSQQGRLDDIHFHLDINGQTVQTGCTRDMLYKVDELIAYISQFFTLKMGDVIFTGTPPGVGPVSIGDYFTGYLEDRKVLEFKVK